jgi:hypothetical protein
MRDRAATPQMAEAERIVAVNQHPRVTARATAALNHHAPPFAAISELPHVTMPQGRETGKVEFRSRFVTKCSAFDPPLFAVIANMLYP